MTALLSFLKKHALTLLLIGLIAYIWYRPFATVTDENRPAAAYSVQLADGQLLKSEAFKGKVVLVNFWATWCPYCRKEMPAIQAFWEEHHGEGFEVLAISVDDAPEKIAAYMKDAGYGFPAAAMDQSVLDTFGSVSTVPTSFIVDRSGIIRHKIAGQVHSGRLDDLVLPLLRAK
jgi:thiol-disulfide isomerase/thioredoxin